MMQRLDLNAVPSAMETRAASWAKSPAKPPPSANRPKPAQWPRPELPQRHTRQDSERLPQPARDSRKDLRLPPSEEKAAERAYFSDMAAMRRFIAPPEPIPEHYVMAMPSRIGVALTEARRCSDPAFAGHLEVPPGPLVGQMLAMGLLCRIGKRDRILSKFAVEVRREVMKDIG